MINISNKTKIIIAMVFLLFDLNLDAGNINFNIFPSFIGFFLLYTALTSLEKKSHYFGTLRTYSFAMSFLFAAVYLLNMFGGLNYIYAMMLSGKEDNTTYVSGLTLAFTSIQLALNIALTLMVLYALCIYSGHTGSRTCRIHNRCNDSIGCPYYADKQIILFYIRLVFTIKTNPL